MESAPDPDWYLDNVLAYASPGGPEPAPLGEAGRWLAWWRRRWLDAGADPCALLARTQGFVLTAAQARGLGWHEHDVRREVRRGTWTPAARGVVAPLRLPEPTSRHLIERRRHALASAAAALVRPGQVIGSRSAAVLHGLPTFDVPTIPELTSPAAVTLGRRTRAHVRSAGLTKAEITDWFGAPVTSVARTIVDLARHDRRDGLLAADAALHERLVTTAAIDAALAAARGWSGSRQAREVLALADPRAESPLESLVRLALHDDGFPPPQLQVVIADPTRGKSYRVDLLWPDHRLVLEADGRGKYTDDEAWRQRRREARLRQLGYRVERVLWSEVVGDWPATRARLARELAASPPVSSR